MAAGSLNLGGNMSLAVGPLGRNAEGMGALNTKGKVAAMCAPPPLLFCRPPLPCPPLLGSALTLGSPPGAHTPRYSYSKTKGLFGGVSVEGSVIVERQECVSLSLCPLLARQPPSCTLTLPHPLARRSANRLAYGSPVTAKQLLSGTIPIPPFADALIAALVSATGLPGGRAWVDDFAPSAEGTGWEAEPVTPLGSPAGERPAYAFAGIGSDGRGSPSAAAGGSSGGGGVGGQPTLGGRTRSGSLLSSVIGRNRSGSLQNAQAGATSSGGGRDRGLSVGSAPSAGAGGGRPDSPSSRPGLFSAVSFGRKRGNSRASSSGYDGSLALGDDSAFHSSESYTSAAPLGSFGAPRSSPSVASPLKPTTTTATTTTATAAGTSRFDERFDASSSSDSLAAGGGGLLGVEDDFARSGLGSSSGGGRGNSFESRYDSQRYSVDDGPAPFSPFDDDAPSSSVHFGPSGPHLASPPPKKPKRPFFSSSPSSSSKLATSSSDFHTRPNTYYDDADAGDVFADPEGAELALIRDGVGRGSVRAEEDWSALGAGARAGLARTQSGNVLSAAAAAAGGSTAGGTTTVPVLAQKKGFELDAGELRARGYVGRGVALFDFQGVEVRLFSLPSPPQAPARPSSSRNTDPPPPLFLRTARRPHLRPGRRRPPDPKDVRGQRLVRPLALASPSSPRSPS